MYVFTDPDVAGLFADMFDQAFDDMAGFSGARVAAVWHDVKKSEQPTVKVCFSPHQSSNLYAGAGRWGDRAGDLQRVLLVCLHEPDHVGPRTRSIGQLDETPRVQLRRRQRSHRYGNPQARWRD